MAEAAGVRAVMTRCSDCGTRCPAGTCGPCKAERRRLRELHRRSGGCEADAAARASRVEVYAAAVARGEALFEVRDG